ncbi:tumor suppressor, Mitostatin [Novymonas esmeraldas]|uniref:Meiosis-specific nuclear structural protein 1 n=1 Tax=Novymonas esmeraldas TaxID=1808958 RepID=A0AAW0EMF1_9TRYP
MSSSESRAERLRRVNRYKAVQAELARQKEENNFAAMRSVQVKSAAADEALAAELAEQQRLDLKDAKMLQLVRDYPEVRSLESQLKDAYLRKSRAEQVTDRSAAKALEAEEQRKYMDYLAEQDKLAKAAEEKKHQDEMERFRRHQAAQLDIIRQHREASMAEAKLREQERIAVDAVVARVQEQDFLETLARRDRQRRIMEEQDEFCRLRAAMKKAEQDREAKEEAAIRAYLDEQARRREMDDKMARERDAVKARILEEQGRRIAEEEGKKRELEQLLQEYYEEERLTKEQTLMAAEQASRDRMAAAVARENQQLIEQRRLAKEAQMAEEMRFRQEAMEQLAAEAKLQQLNRHKQAQLKQQHIAEVQQRLEERRQLKENEKALERKVEEQDRKREEQIQEYIRRARAQLLAEHLPKLGTYAPVRAMRDEEKIQFLPQIKALSAAPPAR